MFSLYQSNKKIRQNDIEAFFALLKGGLWESEVQLLPFGNVDYQAIMHLAEEQSVVGLITAGLEHVRDVKVPQSQLLQFVGQSLLFEQRNKAMNCFIAFLIEKLRQSDIYTLLVKGQGVAQNYERPLWRTCGDVDLFFNDVNYNKAKQLLTPLASEVEKESVVSKHLGMTIDGWIVELHGTLYVGMPNKINRVLEDIQRDTFYGGNVRSWINNGTHVFLLGKENDVLYVFKHFLNHFYKGGIGLRQICDWCRLLWTYRDKLNLKLLETRIQNAGVQTEWKAFAAFAIDYLGMPVEAMPLYSSKVKWKRKADKIKDFILMSGNFGHNRDMSYYNKYPYVIRKCYSMGRRIGDLCRHARIFPLDSLRFSWSIMLNGIKSAIRGE